jgi:predicted transcriptional regulator
MLDFENLDPQVSLFVDEYIDSFITWDLILFFHENPYTVGSSSSIAMSIGRLGSDIEPFLEKMTEKGILTHEFRAGNGAETIYAYKPDSDFEKMVMEFKRALKDRASRLIIVSKVLQKEARR